MRKSVLREVVLLAELGLGSFVLVEEISLPTGAEIDVPTPNAAAELLGILVVLGPHRASLTIVLLLCHNEI